MVLTVGVVLKVGVVLRGMFAPGPKTFGLLLTLYDEVLGTAAKPLVLLLEVDTVFPVRFLVADAPTPPEVLGPYCVQPGGKRPVAALTAQDAAAGDP